MRLSIALVITIAAFGIACSQQQCLCTDSQKTAICSSSSSMSLIKSGCKMANRVLESTAIFQRVFGGLRESSHPQNTASNRAQLTYLETNEERRRGIFKNGGAVINRKKENAQMNGKHKSGQQEGLP